MTGGQQDRGVLTAETEHVGEWTLTGESRAGRLSNTEGESEGIIFTEHV